MDVLDQFLLDSLMTEAKDSERLRANHNFHADLDEPLQRMLVAMEPGSFVPPHRHCHPRKPECLLVIRGALAIAEFEDDGAIKRSFRASSDAEIFGCDFKPETWHGLVSLETGTVFLECKPGPYTPFHENDIPPWAPASGSERIAFMDRIVHFSSGGGRQGSENTSFNVGD